MPRARVVRHRRARRRRARVAPRHAVPEPRLARVVRRDQHNVVVRGVEGDARCSEGAAFVRGGGRQYLLPRRAVPEPRLTRRARVAVSTGRIRADRDDVPANGVERDSRTVERRARRGEPLLPLPGLAVEHPCPARRAGNQQHRLFPERVVHDGARARWPAGDGGPRPLDNRARDGRARRPRHVGGCGHQHRRRHDTAESPRNPRMRAVHTGRDRAVWLIGRGDYFVAFTS